MTQLSDFQRRPGAFWAAVIGLVMLAVYVTVILVQRDDSFLDVLPWLLLMAGAVLVAFASARIEDPRTARSLMIGSAVVFTVLGVLSIFTIGLGFLLAAFLAWRAAMGMSADVPDT